MVLFNYSTKELTAKIVYYGPGLCGKTTNLQFIFENLPANIHKGKMLSLATKTDRTLFFDFLPIDLGTIRGMRTRLQLYTVPGQVFYNTTRKLVLKGADGLVFVADSQKKMLDANIESFNNLEQNLVEHGLKLADMPHILQFNKRDLPEASAVEELNAALNRYNAPIYEAVATTGIGVQDTLKAVTRLVLNSLKEKYGDARRPEREVPVSAAPAVTPPAPAPAPPPPVAVALAAQDDAIEISEADEIEPEPEPAAARARSSAPAPVLEPALALVEEDESVLSVAEEEPVVLAEEDEPADVVVEIEEESPLAQGAPDRRAGAIAAGAPDEIDVLEEDEAFEIDAEPMTLGEPTAIPAAPPGAQARIDPIDESLIQLPDDDAAPVSPLPIAAAEPFEIEASSIEPSPLPAPITPESYTLKMEAVASRLPGTSTETRAVALGAAGTEPLGAREATFPIIVDLQGQPLRLLLTVSVRIEKG